MFLQNVGWISSDKDTIFQKRELFIGTAVRASSPTQNAAVVMENSWQKPHRHLQHQFYQFNGTTHFLIVPVYTIRQLCIIVGINYESCVNFSAHTLSCSFPLCWSWHMLKIP
jgi:hypothetical protein